VRFVVDRRRGIAIAACAAALLTGCAATTYDASLEAPTTERGSASTTSTSVAADTPLRELLTELRSTMRSLDEQVVEGEGDDATLEHIDAIWRVAEDKVHDERPDLLFGFQQAITLARSGVERRRPADASKGYLLLVPLVEDYVSG
jgi:hypothetical protein